MAPGVGFVVWVVFIVFLCCLLDSLVVVLGSRLRGLCGRLGV